MTQPIKVTQAELEILDVLWQHGAGTARHVMEHLSRKKVAYSTVITLLQRMEAKGAVKSRKGDVKSLLKEYFQNDPLTVFSTLVETKKLKAEEIEQMRALLDELENEKK